jgi:hypothetical protein
MLGLGVGGLFVHFRFLSFRSVVVIAGTIGERADVACLEFSVLVGAIQERFSSF